jgi:hypothetical protein
MDSEEFQVRNEKAWAEIKAEKLVQAKLREEARIDPMSDVEIFCQYLEEVAMELRAFPLTIKYLAAVCHPLIEHTTEFWNEQNEKASLKPVPNFNAERGIQVEVDTNPSRE